MASNNWTREQLPPYLKIDGMWEKVHLSEVYHINSAAVLRGDIFHPPVTIMVIRFVL